MLQHGLLTLTALLGQAAAAPAADLWTSPLAR